MERILEEGLDKRFERHQKIAQELRHGLRDIGFTLYVPDEIASNGVTSVLGPEGKVEELLAYVRDQERILLAGSLGGLKGRVFRIGHMGPSACEEAVHAVLAALRNGLRAIQ